MIGDADLEYLRTADFIEANLQTTPGHALIKASQAIQRDPAAFTSSVASLPDKDIARHVAASAPGA